MQASADAKQTATLTAKAAEEAAGTARAAAQEAADARGAAERMAKAAEEAAETARVAAQTAIEAKEAAERTAREAPKVAESAEIASRTAADAKHKAEDLEKLVAKARSANTPAAWSEAHKLAALAIEAKQSGVETFTERVPNNTQPPVLWQRRSEPAGPGADSLEQVLGVPEQTFGLQQGPR
jgi:hypothetical protein